MGFNTVHAIANIFNFVLFLIVIVKFAGPAIRQNVEDRHRATMAAIGEAEEARRLANAGLVATQERLATIDQDLAEVVSQSAQIAARQAAVIADTARQETERMRIHARGEIERERQAAVQDIRAIMLEQAFERAAAELRQQMNAERQRDLVGNLIQKVGDGSLAIK